MAILLGKDKAEDHVPGIVGVGCQRSDPVVVANRVRIAPQVTKILYRHKRADEKLIRNRLQLDYLAQYLCSRLLI